MPLLPKHHAHLVSEGFSETDVATLEAQGVRSITAAESIRLGIYTRTPDGTKQGYAGIYFPFTDSFGQVRCDEPPIRKGKPAKYLTPVGRASQAYIPADCVALTEGYKDAARAVVMGVGIGAMAGVSHYRKALPKGAGYAIVFDSDGWRNPQVFANLIRAGVWLNGKVNLLPPIEGEPKGGMCEWVKAGATKADIEALVKNAYKPADLLLEWPKHWDGLTDGELARCVRMAIALGVEVLDDIGRNVLLTAIAKAQKVIPRMALKNRLKAVVARSQYQPKVRNAEGELVKHESKLAKQFKQVRSVLGDRIKFNQLNKRIELDGQAIRAKTTLRLKLALEHDLEVSVNNADAIFPALAEANAYHPVRDYLDAVSRRFGTDTSILDGMARRYLGNDDPLAEAMLKRTLISAVARVYEPGCKVDTVLILRSGQGRRKSTFFKTLASPDWFCDSFGKSADVEERRKLHSTWIIEWAELSSLAGKDYESIKAFITCSEDMIRPLHVNELEIYKRQSIFVGTTNRKDFLKDANGEERRWWVVEVNQRVPIELLEEERDQIWAAAVALYRAGEQWHLTPLEERQSELNNRNYEDEDPWTEEIADYLEGRRDYSNPAHDRWPTAPVEVVTTKTILSQVCGKPLALQTVPDQWRIGKIMARLGWDSRLRTIDGVKGRTRVWVRPEPEPEAPPPVVREERSPSPLPPMPKLPAPPTDAQPGLTPDRPEWHEFEAALIRATSLEQLTATKDRWPEPFRKEVMERWIEDGRYQWLSQKTENLRT